MRVAVIDVGSSGVRLEISEISRSGALTRIFRKREAVRLGEPVYRNGHIDSATLDLALDAVTRLAGTARLLRARALRIVATAAVRDAENRNVFTNAVYARLGIVVHVLSGEEEARLAAVGARSDPQASITGRLVHVDLGGGSTEVSLWHGERNEATFSLPLGAVRLGSLHLANDPPHVREVDALRRNIQDVISSRLSRQPWEATTLIVSGGTARALGAHIGVRTAPESKTRIVSREDLAKALLEMQAMTLEARRVHLDEHAHRADLIISGGSVLLQLLEHFELDTFTCSRFGLRQGALVDLVAQIQAETRTRATFDRFKPRHVIIS